MDAKLNDTTSDSSAKINVAVVKYLATRIAIGVGTAVAANLITHAIEKKFEKPATTEITI